MKVLQLIDSLEPGGAERMAINIANALVNKIEASFLCATRAEGDLKESINKEVDYLFLKKKKTIDFLAIKRMNSYIETNGIDVIHAHSSSFFFATIIKLYNRKLKLVWHDHYGNRSKGSIVNNYILKICSFLFKQIITVNNELMLWSKKYLWCSKVVYIPNFVMTYRSSNITTLKGTNEKRILCLANLRVPKDHENLIKAFLIVNKKYPKWSLHCVGAIYNDSYSKQIESLILEAGLQNSVFLYGSRTDISEIVNKCNIGVLSSSSEGLPMALLEYGFGGLAVVVTDVGECREVVSGLGLLVKPENSQALAKAIIEYIQNVNRRKEDSKNFKKGVIEKFSSKAIISDIVEIYKKLSIKG